MLYIIKKQHYSSERSIICNLDKLALLQSYKISHHPKLFYDSKCLLIAYAALKRPNHIK